MNQLKGYGSLRGGASEGAFTLIELLVVVALIGILAGIALPRYQTYKDRAYDVAAISAVCDVVTAVEAYNAAVGVYPSVGGNIQGNGTVTVSGNWTTNTGLTIEDHLPGFVHKAGIQLTVNTSPSRIDGITGTHCKGSRWDMGGYGIVTREYEFGFGTNAQGSVLPAYTPFFSLPYGGGGC